MGEYPAIRRRCARLLAVAAALSLAMTSISCTSPSATSQATPTQRATSTTSPTTVAGSTTTRHITPSKAPGGKLSAPVERPLDIRHASLTTDNWATFDYSTGPDTVTASAPSDLTDANVREAFWRTNSQPMADAESCITWDETAASVGGRPIQPGLAMRIASTGQNYEGLKAITVTENVYFSGVWLFNVHLWDTTSPTPMFLLHTFDASDIVGRIVTVDGKSASSMVNPPWHMCGRTTGNIFSFKVWTHDTPEPDWHDPHHVYRVTLPTGWDYAGYAGGYIGHLHPGQSATATLPAATALTR